MLNKDCEMFGGGYCLCNACRSMMKALQETEKIDTEKVFKEAEEIFEQMKAELEEQKE